MEFYIDTDKSPPNWIHHLRLRKYPEQAVGIQVATFNSHAMASNPGLKEKIVSILNQEINHD